MDAIILTQSCDLVSKNIDNILVCRYFSLSDFFNEIQKNETLNAKRRKNLVANLRKGHLVSYHLLNKQEGMFDDYLVVDFKNVYGIHRSTLEEIIKNIEKEYACCLHTANTSHRPLPVILCALASRKTLPSKATKSMTTNDARSK